MVIHFSHLNVRFLVWSFAEFQNLIVTQYFHFIGITETWLRPYFSVNDVNINGYNFQHIARKGRGEGVGFYLKPQVTYNTVLE